MEGSISTFSSRWAPFPPLLPLLPSPSPSTIHFSTAPDLPGRVGAQLTHRSEEAIEADEAPHQIRRGIEHWRRRAKCSSSSRRWSRDPDRASRTSPTPSVSPTHPPGAHGHTTAVPPRHASASFHPFPPDRSVPLRCVVVLLRRLVRFGRTVPLVEFGEERTVHAMLRVYFAVWFCAMWLHMLLILWVCTL